MCFCGIMFINLFISRLKHLIMQTDYIILKRYRQLESTKDLILLQHRLIEVVDVDTVDSSLSTIYVLLKNQL